MTFNEWMETDEAKDVAQGYILSRASMFFDQFQYQSYMRDIFEEMRIELVECECAKNPDDLILCPKCHGTGFIKKLREGY